MTDKGYLLSCQKVHLHLRRCFLKVLIGIQFSTTKCIRQYSVPNIYQIKCFQINKLTRSLHKVTSSHIKYLLCYFNSAPTHNFKMTIKRNSVKLNFFKKAHHLNIFCLSTLMIPFQLYIQVFTSEAQQGLKQFFTKLILPA